MDLPGGNVVRAVPGRVTRRIEIGKPGGTVLAAYLKCYEISRLPRWRWWLGLSGAKAYGQEALNEWRKIQELHRLGFRTARPIAAGWKWARSSGAIRSFVMTAEIGDATPGVDYWRTSTHLQRRRLIERIAGFARQFHQAGFIHKDFYLSHLFVAERNGELDLTLIDLQRVLGPSSFRARWLCKDIGSMMFSLERAGANRISALRLFTLYRGAGRSSKTDKRFLRHALRRVAWLHRRTARVASRAVLGSSPNRRAS